MIHIYDQNTRIYSVASDAGELLMQLIPTDAGFVLKTPEDVKLVMQCPVEFPGNTIVRIHKQIGA